MIEAKDDDDDSALGHQSLLSTESVAPSILSYRKLHGRTYANVKNTEYWGPNDARMNEGLDLIHNSLTMLLHDKLFLAPIDKTSPGRVLDVGTGTGIWAMDFAHEFPAADVVGTDLSPIQPTWVPSNLQFVIDDCLLDWTWPENHFDFIHMRGLYGCVPDWTALHRKVLKHLKPGAWFEQVETGCQGYSDVVELPADHVFNRWAQAFYAGGEKMGRPFTICCDDNIKRHMEEAGFADITQTRFKLPVNMWAKEERLKQAGGLAQLALEQDMEGLAMYLLTQVLDWTPEEVLVLAGNMRKEIRRKSIQPYITV